MTEDGLPVYRQRTAFLLLPVGFSHLNHISGGCLFVERSRLQFGVILVEILQISKSCGGRGGGVYAC